MAQIDYKAYVNADGLRTTYGTGEAKVSKAGDLQQGHLHVTRAIVEWDKLRAFGDATDPTTILDFNARIPKSAFIHKAEFQVMVDWTSAGAATLSMGLADADTMDIGSALTHTGVAADGLDSAIALTALQTADQDGPIVLDGADVAAVTGTSPGGYLLCAEVGTAEFTAGTGVLSVFWSAGVPSTDDT
jgi:hypothetical protein